MILCLFEFNGILVCQQDNSPTLQAGSSQWWSALFGSQDGDPWLVICDQREGSTIQILVKLLHTKCLVLQLGIILFTVRVCDAKTIGRSDSSEN